MGRTNTTRESLLNRDGHWDTVIVGAGLSGLTLASALEKDQHAVLILEQDSQVGGRVKTTHSNGFILDHGFQVFLPAYPECKKLLDYTQLDLKRLPFALSIINTPDTANRPLRISHPFKHPVKSLRQLNQLKIPARDLLGCLKLLSQALNFPATAERFPTKLEEISTIDHLRGLSITDSTIDRLIRPFLRGVLLDPELTTPIAATLFIIKMFWKGGAAVPAQGMSTIPQQLAENLQPNTINLHSQAMKLSRVKQLWQIETTNSEPILAKTVVLTDATAARNLGVLDYEVNFRANTTVYLTAPKHYDLPAELIVSSYAQPGQINHILNLSATASSYSPADQHLLAASILGDYQNDSNLVDRTIEEASQWLNCQELSHLETTVVPQALPNLAPGEKVSKESPNHPGVFLCGDFLSNGSINSAFKAGRQIASQVSDHLSQPH